MEKLKSFSVCHSGLFIGEYFKAKNIEDLLENRLPKRAKNWEMIGFVDENQQNISICREIIENDKLTIDEAIADWIAYGYTKEPISTLNPKNSTLTKGIIMILTEFGYRFEE